MTSLIKPIPGGNPSGRWVKYEDVYDLIQAARVEDDPSLPQGVWKRDLKEADWKTIERLAITTLENQSKDLQIAAWLTEAWLQLNGIRGLNKGFLLIQTLTDRFWETLYPDLSDIEFRLRPFEWINEKISQRLRLYPISAVSDANISPLYFYEWVKYEKKPTSSQKSKFHKKILDTSKNFYQDLEEELSQSLSLLSQIETTIKEKTKKTEALFYKLKEALDNLNRFCKYALSLFVEEKKTIPSPLTSQREETPMLETLSKPKTHAVSPKIALTSRDQAYELLEQIAQYLEALEPHSPTPYLIRRAVTWGHMNLAELMHEFSKDSGGLEQLTKLLNLNALLSKQQSPENKDTEE